MASRRDEMLEVALRMFGERGYDGTSIADLAEATGLSKAAFSYHFTGKDEILVELSTPLIADLETIVGQHEGLVGEDTLEALLGDSIDALLRHRDIAIWIDGDKSVLAHPTIGVRVEAINAAMRRLIAGGNTDPESDVWASSVLGAIWRPIRNLTGIDVSAHRSLILDAALDLASRGVDNDTSH